MNSTPVKRSRHDSPSDHSATKSSRKALTVPSRGDGGDVAEDFDPLSISFEGDEEGDMKGLVDDQDEVDEEGVEGDGGGGGDLESTPIAISSSPTSNSASLSSSLNSSSLDLMDTILSNSNHHPNVNSSSDNNLHQNPIFSNHAHHVNDMHNTNLLQATPPSF